MLERWATVVEENPDAVVFVHELTRGGGWRGADAGDQKGAFEAGRVEATEPLSGEAPPPGEVVWADGSRQRVALVSAAEALAAMARLRQQHNPVCPTCRHLQVTGAKLVSVEHMTSRGPALVPAWEFEFVRSERPTHPISHVALRERIGAQDHADWFDGVGSTFAAYGGPAESELTVGFHGSPCNEADRYMAEVIESDTAIVVIVRYGREPGATFGLCRAMSEGYYVAVELDAPIGTRSVLDPSTGFPVPLLDEEP